jgi:uncharacterized protein YbaR (Trm112 family)
VVLTLKTPWADGTRQLVFEPLTLLERLAALTPRPRINLVLYHGVLAPHAGWRARVVGYCARGQAPVVLENATANASGGPAAAPSSRHWAWAALMRRAFEIDVLACPRCGGRLRLIATSRTPTRFERSSPPRCRESCRTERLRFPRRRTPDGRLPSTPEHPSARLGRRGLFAQARTGPVPRSTSSRHLRTSP